MPSINTVGATKYKDVLSSMLDDKRSIYRPTRFEFRIDQLPYRLRQSDVTDFEKSFQFAIENVFFPGRAIASETIKIAGPVDEIPYESVYSNDLDITAKVSSDFREKALFESWMDIVVNQRTQNLAFPNEYRCDATIEALNLQDEKVYEIKLTEVWPKTVGRVSVGQGLMNSYATMQIGLAFRKYAVIYVDKQEYHGDPNNEFIRDKFYDGRKHGQIENVPILDDSQNQNSLNQRILNGPANQNFGNGSLALGGIQA